VVELALNPATDLWLADHCPTYTRPALPMMSTLDLMAQAASKAAGGAQVVEVSDLQAKRWVIVDQPRRVRAIAELCRRLDGLPLAIELVAAQAGNLTPTAMLARFSGHLDLPAHAAGDMPERQRTLRRTIDWSHEFLDDSERVMLRRLSVFVGGFDIEAAEAVGDDRIMEQSGRVVDPDLFTHGTAEQRRMWFERGFETADPEACTTFDGSLAP
jgi:hypothetical protein